MKFDSSIVVAIQVGTEPTCLIGGCVGQGWQKGYCNVFGEELRRAKKPDGKHRRHPSGAYYYNKCPRCLDHMKYHSTQNAAPVITQDDPARKEINIYREPP